MSVYDHTTPTAYVNAISESRPPKPSDVALARQWAEIYRRRGFNVLPSRMDAKRPFGSYSQWWEEPAPGDLLDAHPTTNLQIVTGRRWRLLVIDLDGPEAWDWFHRKGQFPRTWITHSGGDGHHVWFRLPSGLEHPIPKAILWRGENKHAAVERLCDRSLVVAPPSLHPEHRERRYRFLSRAESPLRLPMPAHCPTWVLALEPMKPVRPVVAMPAPARRKHVDPRVMGRYRASDVLDSVRDKAGIAERAGLRFAGYRPNANGWLPCHAIGREDRHPSASFHADSGTYSEPGANFHLRFFDLLVALGQYADWRDACADLGREYHVSGVA